MTDLERLSKDNLLLHGLMRQAGAWHKREKQLLAVVPEHLRGRCRAHLRADGTLMLLAADSAAAARLRLLLPGLLAAWRRDNADIVAAAVKIRPSPAEPERVKRARLSGFAARNCLETAARLEAFPELAAALRRLAAQAERE